MRRFTVTLGQLYRMALPVPSHFRLSHAALIAPLIVLISPTLAQAQSEWNVGFGASIANPTLIGTVTRRPLQFVTLGAGWTMHDGRIVQIKWTPEIMPFLALSEPHENFFTFITPNSSRNSPQPPGYFFHVDQGPRTIYGGGVSPLSWTFVFFPKHRLVFSLGFKAGIVETAAAVPYQGPIGTAFNYHLGANAEVGWKLPNGTRVAIGAADEHMSNGHVSNGMQKIPVDPGMDFMEFYFRVYIPWKHKGKHPHVTLDR